MRQVVLDTETTGISHELGHRIIEIGCIELVDRKPSNHFFHTYLNPQREVDENAFKIHGISTEFLQDKPLFQDVANDLIEFIDAAELIIHNAPFDIGFLEAELKLINSSFDIRKRCTVCDTLVLAKEKHPGLRNNLDALCKRYEIDNSNRNFHGALLDAEILAAVYLAMTGGQASLFEDPTQFTDSSEKIINSLTEQLVSNSPILLANSQELQRHRDFIKFLVERSGINLWDSE